MAIGETTGSASRGGAGSGTDTMRTEKGGQASSTQSTSQSSGSSGLADRVRSEAQAAGERITDAATDRARSAFEQRQNDIAGQIEGVGAALRDAADRLEEHGQGFPARYMQQAADRVSDFAESVRDRGFDDLVTQTESFARRQPELFIGGAMLIGVGIGRFLRASSERRRAGRAGSQSYGSSQPMGTRGGSSGLAGARGGAYASGGLDELTGRTRETNARADEFARYPATNTAAGRNAPSPMGAGAGGRGASGTGAGGLGDTGSSSAGTSGLTGTGMGAGRVGQGGGAGSATSSGGTPGSAAKSTGSGTVSDSALVTHGVGSSSGTSTGTKDTAQKAGQSGVGSGTEASKP